MADYDLQYQDNYIDALLATANELKTAGYIYKGVATPSTNPGTPSERVAYLASEPGTYTNFGGIVIASGLYSFTYAGGTWTGTQMSAGSDIEVVQTIGQSASDVMSQKAVTDALSGLDKIKTYITGKIRTLAVGQSYLYSEAVKTTDGKMVEIVKPIVALSTSLTYNVGDLVCLSSNTYKSLISVQKYDSTQTYTSGDYAVKEGVVSYYDGSVWSAANISTMVADTNLFTQVDATWLETNATIQNSETKDIFDATHITKENIFNWDSAGLPATNNNNYITPSKTEDGAKWTIKAVAASTGRTGSIGLPNMIFGETYRIRFEYKSTISANASVWLAKHESGTAPSNVTVSWKITLGVISANSTGSMDVLFVYNDVNLQRLAFYFTQPAKNQYIQISNINISQCKSLNDLDIVENSDAESDLDITDENDNILVRFSDGHIRTKNFDSRDIGDLGLTTTKFKNKKFAIIGDSISTFSGWLPSDRAGYDGDTYATYYSHGDVNAVTKTWWYKTMQYLGITPEKWGNINNCSWSGSRVTGNSASTTRAYTSCSERRISDVGYGGFIPDIILISISCNDWGNNIPVGTWSITDAIPSDGTISEFRAGYALMLAKLHVAYPNARIFCCNNLDDFKRDGTAGWPSNNSNGVTTYQWNQNIKEIAEAFGCDVIDMHACGLNYQNIANLVVDEGLHPNEAGMTLMAKKVSAELIAKY